MEQRQLTSDGILVSRLGLGTSTWGFGTDKAEAERLLRAFVEAGGTLVDTAISYGAGRAEEILGDLIGTVVARENIVVATKGATLPGKPPFKVDASRAALLAHIDESLRKLRVDHIDLYQLHMWDPKTRIEETMAALDEILTSGRARSVGICNYAGWQTALAGQIRRTGDVGPLASTQVEYSLVARHVEREVIPAADEFGVGVLPWGPLGRGVLTGKYRAGIPEDRLKSNFFRNYTGQHLQAKRTAGIVDAVVSCAEELGTTPAAIAISWVRDRPNVVAPLVGAKNVEQLVDSLEAEKISLPRELTERLDEVSAIQRFYP